MIENDPSGPSSKKERGNGTLFSLSSSSRSLILFALVLWVLFMLFLYAFKAQPMEKLLASYKDIFLVIVMLACSWILGRLVTGTSLKKIFSSVSVLHPVSIGIGLWMLSLIAFLLAVSRLLTRGIVLTLLALLLIPFFYHLFLSRKKSHTGEEESSQHQLPEGRDRSAQEHPPLARHRSRGQDLSEEQQHLPEHHPSDDQHYSPEQRCVEGSPFAQEETVCKEDRLLIVLLMLIVIAAFLFSFRPPVHYDALEYHLPIPAEFIKSNGLVYFPFDVQTNFPLNVEMLYLLALLLSGWKLANLVNFIFLPLTIALVYAFSRKFFGRTAALVASVVLASTYPVMELSTHPLVDLEFSFFTVASFLLAILWLQEGGNRHFFLSALLSGIALGIKYTACLFTLPLNLLFLILFTVIRKEKALSGLMKIALYLLIVAAAASPWLVRNTINTGDPVFPAASTYIGHEKWTPAQDRLLKKAANESPRDFQGILVLPYRMSFSRTEFGSFSWVGPIYLIFLPLVFIYRKERLDHILILYALLFFLVWAFSFNMTRFAVPLMAVLAILSGRAVRRSAFEEGSRFFRRFIAASLILAAVFNILYFVARQSALPDSMKVVFGIESERNFLSRHLEYFDAIDFYNKIADKNSKILFIGEARTFYCETRAVWSSAYNENPIVPIVRRSSSPVEITGELRSLGITHLLYAPAEVSHLRRVYGAYNLSGSDGEKFIRFLNEETVSLFSDEGVHLLQLKPIQREQSSR